MRNRCLVCHRRLLHGGCLLHPDAAMPAQEEREPPEPPCIPGLMVESFVGRGGFARVFLARQGERRVAVKVARDHARVQREIQALQRLGAPAAPGFLGSGRTVERMPYIIMEYLGTDSLARRMAGRTSRDAVVAELDALAAVVDHMHARGVVHRDLKPENLFFRDPDRACIIDFGLALFMDREAGAHENHARLTRTGQWQGSYEYMAPEQWHEDRQVDRRADLYALAAIAFEMLTGRPPFVGELAAVRHAQVWQQCPRPSDLADVPAAVDAALLRALEKNPALRFASATEFCHALARALTLAPARPGHAGHAADRGRESGHAGSPPQHLALVCVRAAMSTPELLDLARSHDATLACVARGAHVFALPWAGSVAAGVRTATALAQRAGRALCVVHVARLRVRRRSRGITLLGAALQDVAAWSTIPARCDSAGQGVWVTAEAARFFDENDLMENEPGGCELHGHAYGRGHGGFARVRPTAPILGEVDAGDAPLRGRDALLQALVADMEMAARHVPVLAIVRGGPGMGKTRLVAALGQVLRDRERVRVVEVRAAGTPGRATNALAAALGLAPGSRSRAQRARDLARALAAQTVPLAVLVDDAHRMDHAVLDAIEAVLAAPCRVAVCASARPSLFDSRTNWGQGAGRPSRYTLGPLDPDGSHTLIRDLLRPAELVPASILAHVHELAGGIPRYLVEIARALRRGGAIRQVRGMPGHYLAADLVARMAESLPGERLARRALDGVPDTVVPLAELCAVLGQAFDEREARAVVDALRSRAGAQGHAPVLHPALLDGDVGAGLDRLVGLGFLARDRGRFAVVPPIVGQAVERAVDGARRRALHRACLEYWQARASHKHDDRLARHAAACGEADIAARAYLRMAEKARAEHRHVAAEQGFSAAIEHLATDDPAMAGALAGRGRVRYKLQRFDGALADLRRARALFEVRACEEARLELLLEEATALHWCQDAAASARVAQSAFAPIQALGVPRLCAAAALARGRIHYERQELEPAIELFAHAARTAAAAGAHDTHAAALLLLAPALVYRGRVDHAAACFDQVEALCRRAGDGFHLATTYLNRAGLWIRRGQGDRARADLDACILAAERLGNAQLERAATFNLAELLYWQGDFDRARALAERSRALVMQFLGEYRPHEDHLLLGRILCAQADPGARRFVEWVETYCPVATLPPSAKTLMDMVALALRALTGRSLDAAAWHALARTARDSALLDEHVEVLAVAAHVFAMRDRRDQARQWLERARGAASALWAPRLRALAASLE